MAQLPLTEYPFSSPDGPNGRQQEQTKPSVFNLSNALTMSRVLLTPVFLGLFFADGWYWKHMALLVFAIASLTDLYDGYLARRGGTVTKVGRFLDPLADKILVSSALISFVRVGLVEVWLVGIIVGRDVLMTTFRVYALYNGKQLATSKLAKWKTMTQLVVIFVILGVVSVKVTVARLRNTHPMALVGPWASGLSNGLIFVVALLTVISGIGYLLSDKRYV